MKFTDYKNFFSSKGDYAGEHHFVSLCLVPLILDNIEADQGKEFKFINPDGMKGCHTKKDKKVICDITYAGKGVEVKYSLNNKLKFTRKQIDAYDNCEDFWGFIAIVDVGNNGCRVVGIKREDFYSLEEVAVARKKAGKYLSPITVNDNHWLKILEKDFLEIFGIQQTHLKAAA